jgi:prepilin-type N-terminal cleavage/methylation domain-containing protein
MKTEFPASSAGQRGFSLIELGITVIVLGVVMGALMQFMGVLQQRYTREQAATGLGQTGKTGLDLLAMDIGQAGKYPVVTTTSTNAITAGAAVQTITLGNGAGVYPGSVLLIDIGDLQEPVRVLTVSGNDITAVCNLNHAAGALVRDSGVPYAEGIIFNTDVNTTSSNTRLRIFGDIDGTSVLRYIEYKFTANATACTGTLTRSDTLWSATTKDAEITVADNLCNDSGSTAVNPLFTYTTTTIGAYSYVTAVTVNMIMRTQAPIERGAAAGGTRTVVMRQAISPRNIAYASRVAADGGQQLVPERPGTIPVPPLP